MSKKYNLLLDVDSYKASHYLQYPKSTRFLNAYVEPRDLNNHEVVFFGLQAFIKNYLLNPITHSDIVEAENFFLPHIGTFNKLGWSEILEKHNGYLPIEIQAIAEGSVVNKSIPLVQIINTDPHFPWLVTYLETALLRAIWYPSSVATISREAKKIILRFLKKTSDNPEEEIGFKLHDFGARGVSSYESSRIGGAAHLLNFLGSDTVEGALFLKDFYHADMPSLSIPASEHSTIISWGESDEKDAHENIMQTFLTEEKTVASVIDSYDLFETAEKIISTDLKNIIENSKGTFVARPDSGILPDTVIELIQLLMKEENFGFYINSKGYKVLPDCIRVIQGDGVDLTSIELILKKMEELKLSASNIAFGMGGGLLQKVNRDTYSFAMKLSAIKQDGENWIPTYKNPKNDNSKASKKGYFYVYKDEELYYSNTNIEDKENLLKTIYRNGKLVKEYHLDEIKKAVEVN